MNYIATKYLHNVEGKEYHKGRLILKEVIDRNPVLIDLGWVEKDPHQAPLVISNKDKSPVSVKTFRGNYRHGKKTKKN